MKRIIYLLPIIAIILIYTYFKTGSDGDYLQQVEKTREERVRFLKSSDASPFKVHNIDFKEPAYFQITKDYRVNATLERFEKPERISIQNSDGTAAIYTRFAFAHFKLKDTPLKLLILKPVGFGELNNYFTGFADNTSGNATYGGGRYLDLEIGKSDKLVIDFNLAYNPYCAYVDEYQCPFPPKENILPVRIEAGEKDYTH